MAGAEFGLRHLSMEKVLIRTPAIDARTVCTTPRTASVGACRLSCVAQHGATAWIG